ncbi:MAG TPA: exo-alpha-sialidase [Candidatus Hydrogenedentes bacterium]|nr:exo-alpha-sialidase [Candidatus Hydrogenedentota bacterium]
MAAVQRDKVTAVMCAIVGVGFVQGAFRRVEGEGHPIDPDEPELTRFARSLDGGKTWTIEKASFEDANGVQRSPVERTEPVDFSHPDFAMRLRMNNTPPGHSRIHYSYDRCKTWEGPYKLPLFDLPEVMARTDYIVNGSSEALAFVTGACVPSSEVAHSR